MRERKRLHDIVPVHTAGYKRFTLVPHYKGVPWCPGSVHISRIPKLDKRLNGLKVEVIILREYEEMHIFLPIIAKVSLFNDEPLSV